jgi:uncharacterized protein (TIGR02246 family)
MRTLLVTFVLAGSLSVSGCGLLIGTLVRDGTRKKQEESQVVASLERYRTLALAADADRVADLFTDQGELSNAGEPPHRGPEQIRSFLKGLGAYQVRQYDLHATTTQVDGGAATEHGTYAQIVVTLAGNTVETAGDFDAEWVRQPDGRWLLRRMHTIPATAAVAARS